jgi:hypothetical protein
VTAVSQAGYGLAVPAAHSSGDRTLPAPHSSCERILPGASVRKPDVL